MRRAALAMGGGSTMPGLPTTTGCQRGKMFRTVQKTNGARPLWLTPVILASQEAEIRRFQASLGK
jgi:hypothetical protein